MQPVTEQIELFIHTETTGIYKSTMELTDAAQPWICRFSMIAREQSRIINTANLLVRCEHPIPAGAYGVHGISLEDTHKYGVPPKAAHALLAKHLAMGPVIYGYNVDFVLGCLKVQAARLGDPIDLGTNTDVCVMQEAYDWMYSGESDHGQMKLPRFEEAWGSCMPHDAADMNSDRSLRVFDIARMHDYVEEQNLACEEMNRKRPGSARPVRGASIDDVATGPTPSGLPPLEGDEHPSAPLPPITNPVTGR